VCIEQGALWQTQISWCVRYASLLTRTIDECPTSNGLARHVSRGRRRPCATKPVNRIQELSAGPCERETREAERSSGAMTDDGGPLRKDE
jgi:hypothetical protein